MGATLECEGIETSMPCETHEIQICQKHQNIRSFRNSNAMSMCHDMMLMKFNLFLGPHHMTGDVKLKMHHCH